MKQHRSRFLSIIAGMYMAFPLVYLTAGMVIFDISVNDSAKLILSPFYYVVSFWAILAGYGLWEMRRWSWYVFLIANVLICYQNAYTIVTHSGNHHKFLLFLISVSFVVALIYRVSTEIRVPYFLPKIRWWETDPRYRLSVPVRITWAGHDPVDGEILDLSLGGCFIKLRGDVPTDTEIGLDFRLDAEVFTCLGEVVWKTQSTVTHPKGVGVKFRPLDRVRRRQLKRKLKTFQLATAKPAVPVAGPGAKSSSTSSHGTSNLH